MDHELSLEKATREEIWKRLIETLESYPDELPGRRVMPPMDPAAVRELFADLDFAEPMPADRVFTRVVEGLLEWQTHVAHPRYYGLFNPAPATMAIAGDALAAAFNPQLAAWSHSPFAIEAERHLVGAFAERFGYAAASSEGTFASGGAEANHTAILAALTRRNPEVPRHGVRALRSQPVLYVSSEGHDSIAKASRLSGLGTDSVRAIGVSDRLTMSPEVLRAHVRSDREQGFAPFMVVATAGTTSAGAFDPLLEIAEVALEEDLWLHVDAAWGGAAALVPELADAVRGIQRADSITFDAHKYLSVPMGAGLFLTRHPGILERTFRVSAGYMPREAEGLEVIDPWASSMQWSRRFIGLKVLMALATAGWSGYERVIRHQTAMGEALREGLGKEGWRIVNDTPLPLVCWVDETRPDGASERFLRGVASDLVGSGKAWISTVGLGPLGPALRACITNYKTEASDIEALVRDLGEARARQPAAG